MRLLLMIVALMTTAIHPSVALSADVVADPKTRTWTDTAGRQVQAAFAGLKSGKVALRRADGTVLQVLIDRLSAADRDFARSQAANWHAWLAAAKKDSAEGYVQFVRSYPEGPFLADALCALRATYECQYTQREATLESALPTWEGALRAVHGVIRHPRRALVPELLTVLRTPGAKPLARYHAAFVLFQFDDLWWVEELDKGLKRQLRDKLEPRLGDPDVPIRAGALALLPRLAGAASQETLLAALRDKEPAVRAAAAKALGLSGAPAAVPPLITALQDKWSAVRTAAASALGEIADPRAVEPLIAATNEQQNKNAGMRSAGLTVIEALGKIGDPRAVAPLIVVFGDKDYNHLHAHEAAILALQRIGAPAVAPVLVACQQRKMEAHYAGRILSASREPRAAEAILGMEKAARPGSIHFDAKGFLRSMGEPAVGPLIAATKDPDRKTQGLAIELLANIGGDRAATELLALAKAAVAAKSDFWPAVNAAEKVARPEDFQTILTAMETLGTGLDVEVRRLRVKSLARAADPRTAELAAAMLTRNISFYDDWVKKSGSRELAAAAAEIGLDALRDAEQVAAIEAIGLLGDRKSVPLVLRALKEKTPPTRRKTLGGGDPRQQVREAAANALGNLKAKEAVPTLLKMLPEANWELLPHLAAALGKIGDPRAVDSLIWYLTLDLRKQALEAMAEVKGMATVDKVRELVEQAWESEGRDMALQLLGFDGPNGAIPDENGKTAAEGLPEDVRTRIYNAISPARLGMDRNVIAASTVALGAIADARAVKPLAVAFNTNHARVGDLAAAALSHFNDPQIFGLVRPRLTEKQTNAHSCAAIFFGQGWQPQDLAEVVHLLALQEQREALLAIWPDTKATLLKDLDSKDVVARENSARTLVRLGRDEVTTDLLALLKRSGSQQLARTLFEFGNDKLQDAAASWAKEHGCSLGPSAEQRVRSEEPSAKPRVPAKAKVRAAK